MKKNYISLLLLFVAISSNAQMLLQNDDSHVTYINPETSNPNALPEFSNENKVYNVNFHIIAETDATVGAIGENEMMTAIRNLNVSFNQFNIFFKYRGYDVISNSDYLVTRLDDTVDGSEPTLVQLNDYSVANSFENNESINIFIVNKINQNLNGGTEILPGTEFNYNNTGAGGNMPCVFIMSQYFTTGVTVHEIGHIFGLYHTNRAGFGPQPNGATFCEHVNRNTGLNDPIEEFNYATTGDYIADTYASPESYSPGEVNSNGEYIGNGTDCMGVPYNFYPGPSMVPIRNFMNVNQVDDIQYQREFTPGQGTWMRNNMAYSPNIPFYTRFETTVSSLYEPFEVQGIAGNNIISVTDAVPGDGMATVCRNYLLQHRFQEGFSYLFPDSTAGDPTEVAVDYIPVIKQNTFDFRVKILQVSPDDFGTVKVVCTKAVVCNDEAYISGKLYSTQVLGSMNITEAELDKIQVTDPQLYDKLMSQYYYILKKMTESGAIKEEVFYKP